MRLAILGGAALLAAACASIDGGDCKVAEAPAEVSAYKIHPGDRIEISVYEEEAFKGVYNVDAEGRVSLPLIGPIQASGMTLDDFVVSLRQKLSEDALNNPRVNAQIVGHAPYFVMGEVARPGSYEFRPMTTPAAAIASAGGFTYRAQSKCFKVRPADGGPDRPMTIDSKAYLSPGDVLIVGSRTF